MSDKPPANFIKRLWRKTQETWWRRRLVDLVLIAIAIVAVTAFQTRNLLPSGSEAPAFSLTSLTGETKTLDDYRGRKVLLAFWDPWCSMCGLEASNLQTIADEGEVAVVSVVLGRPDPKIVRAFQQQHEISYEVLYDDGTVAPQYEVEVLPTLYVLDEEGRVSSSMAGYTTTLGIRARL